MIKEFTVGFGVDTTKIVYHADLGGNMAIHHDRESILVPIGHILSFIAMLAKQEKKYELEMMSDREVLGLPVPCEKETK